MINMIIDDFIILTTNIIGHKTLRHLLRELFLLMDDNEYVFMDASVRKQLCDTLGIIESTLKKNLAILKRQGYITTGGSKCFKLKTPICFRNGSLGKIIEAMAENKGHMEFFKQYHHDGNFEFCLKFIPHKTYEEPVRQNPILPALNDQLRHFMPDITQGQINALYNQNSPDIIFDALFALYESITKGRIQGSKNITKYFYGIVKNMQSTE